MPDEPLTITAAAQLIRSGELTPSELLEQCLRRIDVYEPHVKAWVYLDRERARRDAARLTDEVKTCYRGPLHGIPIGIKDIIDVFDMPTGCGSKLWANSYARQDATVVDRLRQAGAIILGKTVTTPYAFTDPPVTRNPWNLNRTPGGSSSGSAAAVACGMCLGALGTQTGGSLTRPASYCGVCSLKPTWGHVSVDGVLPLAPSLDHVGVMANCVRDLAILFEAIAESALRENRECAGIPDCIEAIDRPRVGIPYLGRLTGFFDENMTQDMTEAYSSACSRMVTISQFTLEICKTPSEFAGLLDSHRTIMAAEAARYHSERRLAHPDDYPPSITRLIKDGESYSGRDLSRALDHRNSLVSRLQDLMSGRIYFTPAASDFAPTPETTGDPRMNAPWSFTGLPTVSIPVGRSKDELQYALQFVGRRNFEDELLAVVGFVEKDYAEPRRLPPVPA